MVCSEFEHSWNKFSIYLSPGNKIVITLVINIAMTESTMAVSLTKIPVSNCKSRPELKERDGGQSEGKSSKKF
jgi:hypothetical protein